MHAPKLVFVDAPTAVGKDYFIDHFVSAFAKKHPSVKIRAIRATDVVLNAHSQSENRKYTAYQTEDDKKLSIYVGHLRLASYLTSLLTDHDGDTDVVVVNRSFLSFLIYNVYPEIRQETNDKKRAALIVQYTDFVDTYVSLGNNLFRGLHPLFIRLTLSATGELTQGQTLVSRIEARSDGKPVDRLWLSQILRDYNEPDSRLMKLFPNYEVVTSGDYDKVLNKYYR